MRRRFLIGLLLCAGIFISDSCVDPYNPSVTRRNVRYLVVDAFMNATDGTCLVKISRTIPLDEAQVPYEANANVRLEDENGVMVSLAEGETGQYTVNNLVLNQDLQYRITITTEDGTSYASDFVSVLQSPAIDSITWKSERKGLSVLVNTHDPNNRTRYYYWSYSDTWEYTAGFKSYFKVVNGEVVLRDGSQEDAIYNCWRTASSHDILVSSSNQLQQDIISEFTVLNIPWQSPKTKIKYSMLLEQRAISKEAYEYYQLLKKNTEELGTLFDPLPSGITGNFKCISKPSEIVLGYFNISTVDRKRVFIGKNEIDRPADIGFVTEYDPCQMVLIPPGSAFGALIPLFDAYDVGNGNAFLGHYAASTFCADCRVAGGTNVKPDFWQ